MSENSGTKEVSLTIDAFFNSCHIFKLGFKLLALFVAHSIVKVPLPSIYFIVAYKTFDCCG
jgi:hypothetical protein